MKELIEKVRKIDPKAAEYLESEDKDEKAINWTPTAAELDGLMVWSQTPQEHNYWNNIFIQLRKGGDTDPQK